MKKRGLCLLLALAAVFSLTAPAFAESEITEEPLVTEEPVAEPTEEPVEPEVPEGPEAEATEAPVVTEVPVEEVPAEPVVTEAPVEVPTEEPVVTEVPAEEVPAEPAGPEVPAEEIPVEPAGPEVPAEEVLEEPSVIEVPVEVTEAPEATAAPEEAASEEEPMTAEASNVIDSGVCGAQGGNVTWTLTGAPWDGQGIPDTTDWVLTISGAGDMADYGERESPWAKYTHIEWSFPSAVIGEGVTSVGASAFFNASMLTSVSLPSTLKVIGTEAFAHAFNLVHITIPDGVTEIRNSAFYWCVKLAEVNIPSGVKAIGDWAFCQCGMTSVTIPEGVVSIGEGAFQQCANLTSVTVPASVTAIGDMAFFARKLESITVLNPDCVIGHETYKEGEEYYASIDYTLGDSYSGTVIHGYDGSTAEAYAKRWWFTFQSLGPNPFAAKPAQPKVSKVTNGAEGVTIAWNTVPGALSYQVMYKTGTGKWKTLADAVTGSSYTWPAAKSGTKYSFSVQAQNAAGVSGYNKTGKSTTYMAQPKVKSAKIDASGVKITWAKVKGATKYQVMYKVGDGDWKVLAKSATGTSYTWKKAKSGTSYTFSVRAVAKDGSKGVYDETGKSLTYVAAPKVKSVKKVSGGIKITWAKVNGAAKYQVMYRIGNGKWKALTTTDKRTFTWKKAKNGTKYTFSVRAVAADGTKSVYNTTGKTLTYKK